MAEANQISTSLSPAVPSYVRSVIKHMGQSEDETDQQMVLLYVDKYYQQGFLPAIRVSDVVDTLSVSQQTIFFNDINLYLLENALPVTEGVPTYIPFLLTENTRVRLITQYPKLLDISWHITTFDNYVDDDLCDWHYAIVRKDITYDKIAEELADIKSMLSSKREGYFMYVTRNRESYDPSSGMSYDRAQLERTLQDTFNVDVSNLSNGKLERLAGYINSREAEHQAQVEEDLSRNSKEPIIQTYYQQYDDVIAQTRSRIDVLRQERLSRIDANVSQSGIDAIAKAFDEQSQVAYENGVAPARQALSDIIDSYRKRYGDVFLEDLTTDVVDKIDELMAEPEFDGADYQPTGKLNTQSGRDGDLSISDLFRNADDIGGDDFGETDLDNAKGGLFGGLKKKFKK